MIPAPATLAEAPAYPVRPRPFRIQPSKRLFTLEPRELWKYRELLLFLVWRDVKVRYKQTVLGAAWAIVQPLLAMLIFTVIFGRVVGVPSQYGTPYAVFVYVGLLPWTYFSTSLASSSLSIVGSSNLVTKVYFPRLLIPLASILVPLVDFVFAFGVLGALYAWYGLAPPTHAFVLLVFLVMAMATATGVGLWLSALNVRYRDVPYVVPFLMQFWLYASPVIYPVTLVPKRFQWLLALNPMTGVIDGFRWALLGSGTPEYTVYGTSAAVAVVLLATGLLYFRAVERRFADLI